MQVVLGAGQHNVEEHARPVLDVRMGNSLPVCCDLVQSQQRCRCFRSVMLHGCDEIPQASCCGDGIAIVFGQFHSLALTQHVVFKYCFVFFPAVRFVFYCCCGNF
jgi:hypothetical protein